MSVTCAALIEVDIATAPAFLAEMREAIDWAESRTVVIDCSAISFMDTSGFHALRDANDYAIEQDHLLAIRGLVENCRRVVRICDPRNEILIES